MKSLYLDIYLNGKRSYEYLKLYLVPEKSREDKKKNKETLQLAEAIRAKRVVELRNGEFGFKKDYAEDTLCSWSIMKITPQAAELMGERGKPTNNVFTDVHSPTCTNQAINTYCTPYHHNASFDRHAL